MRKQSPLLCAAAGGSASFSNGSGKASFQHEEGEPQSGTAASGTPKLLVYILFWSASDNSLHLRCWLRLQQYPGLIQRALNWRGCAPSNLVWRAGMRATSPSTSCATERNANAVILCLVGNWKGLACIVSGFVCAQINKQTLNAFPMPYAIATWQLAASVLCGAVLWITKTIPRPHVTGDFAKALLPVALFHTLVRRCLPFRAAKPLMQMRPSPP